jgi:glucosamine--fructose-6-phosphate aminotransferase (isomerizing)
VESLPEIIRNACDKFRDESREVFSTPEQFGLQLVLLTGCGDSASVARAAAFAWHELAGVPAFYVDAMTVARYYGRQTQRGRPAGQLLLAVSASGRVARVVEAARQLRGTSRTLVCAATADTSSPLAEAADRILDTSSGAPFASPGLASYVVNLLGILHLAIRSGEVRGRYTMDEADRLRQVLATTSETVAHTIASGWSAVRAVAESWAGFDCVELLGSGPARASAAFGAAKILEAVGLWAIDQDLEEFMHLQYFERRPEQTATLVINPSDSAAASRAAEVQRSLATLRRPHVLLSDASLTGSDSITYPSTPELFAPVVHAAVLGMLAADLADLRNERPGRGAIGQWADSRDGAAVTDSTIELSGRAD